MNGLQGKHRFIYAQTLNVTLLDGMKTISIKEQSHHTLKRWAKAKNMKMHEFIEGWINAAENKMQQEFYNSLPMPTNFRKPLEGVKIDGFCKK